MSEISVILPVCNHEKHVHDAVKSILNQSFQDFELMIADYGSMDDTLSIVNSFDDSRIRKIARNDIDNRINALNAELESASGNYIAMMEADHVMHVDRLKIQHATMEAEPTITVCSSRIKQVGARKPERKVAKSSTSVGGLFENHLLDFLWGNCIAHTTVMIRNQFLKEHQLRYENYSDAEDFKLWAEIAKRGGQFYIDTQTLLSCHAANQQEDEQKLRSSENVIHEIVEFLVLLPFVWKHIQIPMKEQYCNSEVFGISVSSSNCFQFLY